MAGITIFVPLSRRWPESCLLSLRSTRKTKYSVDDSDNKGGVLPSATLEIGVASHGINARLVMVILVLRRIS